MADDDLFWQIAMAHESGTDTTWLVPNDVELLPDDNGLEPFHRVLDADLYAPPSAADDEIHSVYFQELLLEAGVMSKIGGEVWEASLLLCAYIFLHRDRLFSALPGSGCLGDFRAMELGSGIGLPGVLVASLLRHRCSKVNAHVTLTDFDNSLLENLCTNAILNGFKAVGETCGVASSSSRITLSVDYLNWFDFKTAPSVPIEALWKRDSVDIMFGSALVYSPSHSAVADVIDFLLRPCDCNEDLNVATRRREAIIIQIGDRAGMDYFQRRMTEVGLSWAVGEVPEECYRLAKSGMAIHKYNPHLVAAQDAKSSNRGKVQRLSIDLSCLDSDCVDEGCSGNEFLRTPRECFRLITAWKQAPSVA
jgi:hypothetical protein